MLEHEWPPMHTCCLAAASRGWALLQAVAPDVPDAALLLSLTRSTPATLAEYWSSPTLLVWPHMQPCCRQHRHVLLEVAWAAICPAIGADRYAPLPLSMAQSAPVALPAPTAALFSAPLAFASSAIIIRSLWVPTLDWSPVSSSAWLVCRSV